MKLLYFRYKLILSGTADKKNKRSTTSFQPSEAAIAEMKELEIKRGRRISIKRNAEVDEKESHQNKEKSTEERQQQEYLKGVIHDVSSYLQQKGFEENHILDILNNGMAASSEVKKGDKSKKGLSQRAFGEDNIDHDKFIDGMSRAVGDIFEKRRLEKQRQNKNREKVREEMEKEKAIERRKQMLKRLENEKRAEELKTKERIAEAMKASEVMKEMMERERQEKLKEKQVEREKEERENMAARYIERYLDNDEDTSPEEIDKIIREVRKILQKRK